MLTTLEGLSLATARAALVPELRRYVETRPDGWPMLRSPWVYQVPLVDTESANALYKSRAARGSAALLRGDFSEAIANVERPYRVQAMYNWWRLIGLNGEELRRLLADELPGIEFLQPDQAALLRMLRAVGRVTDRHASDAHEKADGEAQGGSSGSENVDELVLPTEGRITIYRGARDPRHVSLAWTLDREVACWFARRFGIGSPTLFTGDVAVSEVRAAFIHESTILVDPKHVRNLQREAV